MTKYFQKQHIKGSVVASKSSSLRNIYSFSQRFANA